MAVHLVQTLTNTLKKLLTLNVYFVLYTNYHYKNSYLTIVTDEATFSHYINQLGQLKQTFWG